MTMAGGVVGVLYAAVRPLLAPRLRVPLWALAWAAIGGGTVVHEDGVDFVLLEPTWLAILLFVLLPGAGAAAIALLTERWSRAEPWAGRRMTAGLGVAAAAATVALAFALAAAAVVTGVRLVWARLGRWREPLGRVALVLAPAVLIGLTAIGAVDLVQESGRLLD
jgi:hypothetical protein